MDAATLEFSKQDELLRGMQVLSDYRERGVNALSEYAACFVPLLRALGWSGGARHIAESFPHFKENLDLESFRAGLANLNYKTIAFRNRQDNINPGLFPCLFVPDEGSVRILLAPHEEGQIIYDGVTCETRISTGLQIYGTAYFVKPMDQDGATGQAPNQSWMGAVAERFRGLFTQVVVITFVFNLLSLGMPLFMLMIYDTVIPSGSVYQMYYLLIGVLLALGFEYALRKVRAVAMAFLAGRLDFLIGTTAFQKVLLLPTAMTENEPIGTQISHLQEFESIREFFAGPLGETFLDLPFVLLFLTVIALLAGWLVLIPIVAAIVFVLCSLITSPIMKRAMARVGRVKSIQNRFLVEAVSDMRSIKFAGAENIWLDRFGKLSAATATDDFRVSMVNHSVQMLSRFIMLGSGIAMIGFGAGMVISSSITVGGLVASMALVWRALAPLQASFMTLNRVAQIRLSVQQLNHLMRLKVERPPGAVPLRRQLRGAIEFIGVSQRFGPETEPALVGVSFGIEQGQVLAITGPNGAGKSTIVNLLSGVYRPQHGSVLIDGIDVRQTDPIDLRQQIGLVPQTSELLYGTVAQNLRLSVPTATDGELVVATKVAGVYDDIQALPEKFDTRLTETFLSSLTEGFKQKLTLARAFLRTSPIMIFDESGETLDEHGDKAFMAAVRRLRGKSTILIITHRPSHMRLADRLMVVRSGKVELLGPPEEVLERLAESQS